MASGSKPPSSQDDRTSTNDNPFLAFKKYADEQFASFFQNFIGLPSSTQLCDLERSYFDENGRLKPISDLIDKAVEAVKTVEAKETPLEPRKQRDRRRIAMRVLDSPLMDMVSELSMDPFEQWQRQAERYARNAADPSKPFRCPYRPQKLEPSMHCPYRPAISESAAHEAQSSRSPANVTGLPSWFKQFESDWSYPNHVATHRSLFGINSHIQNVPLHAWPLPYIAMSPYSPLVVERELRNKGESTNIRWRYAFEDLVLLNKGNSMEDMKYRNRNPMEMFGRPSKDRVPGIRWVSDMIDRGLLGDWRPLEPAFAHNLTGNSKSRFQLSDDNGMVRAWETEQAGLGSHQRKDEDSTQSLLPRKDEGSDDEVTELDLYEHFLENRNRASSSSSSSSSSGQQSPTLTPDAGESSRNIPNDVRFHSDSFKKVSSSIISTLTTTERQVLPDGTVHTKVVLKRRFADGREESNEAEHTRHAESRAENIRAANSPTLSPNAQRPEEADDQKDQKPKSGWFW